MMRHSHFILALLAASTLLGGCSSNPQVLRDPDYAPVLPVTTQSAQSSTGAIYRPQQGMSLFSDEKAYRVGDLVTVLLVEKTDASKSASTSTARESNMAMPGPTLFGLPVLSGGNAILNNDVSSASDFTGDGASNQSNSLSGSITVTVSEVLPNGYLRIRGEKLLSLNQGDEFIRLAGIVRPADINPDNSIESTKLADTHITYGGSGVLADANTKGWLSRFFDVVWPF